MLAQIKSFISSPPVIPKDKANHVSYGAGLSVLGLFGVFIPYVGWAMPVIVATALGARKEIVDKVKGTGNPEWWDLIATALGGTPLSLGLLLGSIFM